MENTILKIIGLVCMAVIAVTVLITNKDDEDVATKVCIFTIIALIVIFAPWGDITSAIKYFFEL